MSEIGHNSQIGGIAADALRQFIERIERLEEEKRAVAADIKDVYFQAKSQGFNTKTMRKLIAERRVEEQEREEQEQLLDLYKAALGMLSDTPLGQAAVGRQIADPAVRESLRDTVDQLVPREDGSSVTISVGGTNGVTLKREGGRVVASSAGEDGDA